MKRFDPSRIREARGGRRAEELAVAVGVSLRTVHSWETGKTAPTANQLAAICAFTGRPESFFFVTAPAA